MDKKETPQDRWQKKQEKKTMSFKLFLSKQEDLEVLEFFEKSEKSNMDTLKMLIEFYKKNS